jgi:hypothetical protein
MVLKRSLSAVLAVSMVLSTAGAQPTPGMSGTPNDAIDLILQATMSKSPQEARQLLAQAKTKAENEKLSPDTMATIEQLLKQASLKLTLPATTTNPLGGGAPVSFNVDGKGDGKTQSGETPKVTSPVTPTSAPTSTPVVTPTPTPAPKPTVTTSAAAKDPNSAIAAAIELNPDVHMIMREIGVGRIQRDSNNLDQIVKANTNQTIDATDRSHAITDAVLADAGEFIKALRSVGVLHDWSAVNKALKEKHESVPVDVLAKQIIQKSSEKALLAGVLKRLVHSQGLSTRREFAGISIEALGVYAINADLILRMADLYDMNLSESQQDIAILTILPLGKLFLFAAKQRSTVKHTAERLGELYGQAKANPNPNAMAHFFTAVFSSPIMAGLAKTMGLGSKAGAVKSAVEGAGAKEAPAAKPVAAAPEVAPPVKAPPPVAGQLEGAVAKIEGAAAAAESAASKAGSLAEKAAKAPLSWKAQALWLLASTIQSGAETYATGRVAMWWFSRQKQKARDVQTADFHAFLMQDKARGFFKLLIATLNAGSTLPAVYNVKKSKDDRRVDFLMSIARSVRICSPEDSARFQALKAKGNASTLDAAKNMVDSDYRLLRFECDTALGFSRYNQIAKEFMTFNAIPQWEVAQLRLASYEERMQMGELLMQAQFLYEEPNDNQIQFFQTTIAKILGLNRVEDVNYFSRLYGFIRTRGGMMQNVSSPSGWSIRTASADDPWALAANYTIPGGPDIPPPPPAGK